MNTSLAHLPLANRDQLRTVTRIIANAIRPEKIILFGMYGTTVGGPNFLADSKLTDLMGSYELLIVTRRGDRRFDYELQDIIENRCKCHTSVTVLVHDIDYVNKCLSEGHYFFSMIRRRATLLYDGGNIPLIEGARPDLKQIRVVAEKDLERWGGQAKVFYRSALFNREQKELKIAVFLLHQAAEHMYQAIQLVFTGYKPCTHNLDKLRRYTNRFSIELATLFGRDGKDDDGLFRLLQQGYIDARYKEDYNITEETLDRLMDRVGTLLSIGERLCRNRLTSLDRMNGADDLSLLP